MILFATSQTLRYYGHKTMKQLPEAERKAIEAVNDFDFGDGLLKWGLKLFDFDRFKCLQAVNFASKLTLFMFDIEEITKEDIGDMIAFHLLELFKRDPETTRLLERMFQEDRLFSMAPLTNKSIIAKLNRNLTGYVGDGNRFWHFVENGVLQSKKINHDFNFDYFTPSHMVGSTNMPPPAEQLKKLLRERDSHANHPVSRPRRSVWPK